MINSFINTYKIDSSQWYAWNFLNSEYFLAEVKGETETIKSLMRYDKNRWVRNGQSWIKEQIPFVTTYQKREVINIIKDSSEKIQSNKFDSIPHFHAFRNYTVDFSTCSIIPHHPDHLITKIHEFDISNNLPSSIFQNLLDWFYPKSSHQLIEEFLYYVLCNDGTYRGPILSINGDTKTSKSALGRICNTLLLGNVAFPNMDQLRGFEGGYLENFISDKALCVLDEDVIANLQVIKPWLKRMTGGNPSTSRQVGSAVSTSDEIRVPIILTTNSRPKDNEHLSFSKEDEAFYNRVLCVDTIDKCPIPINKRTTTWEKVNILENTTEIAGIICRLLKAGKRLQKRGYFDDGLSEKDRWLKFK
ncbi:MAG: hypothetical protein HeimC2_21180 [Candidatus Heimdallarchaeota archaeon LC_2]|nr:MAG: hypothetical protein HeimC2_21180 [Candidatus Heimdallarchaeota archaeon LC_2]